MQRRGSYDDDDADDRFSLDLASPLLLQQQQQQQLQQKQQQRKLQQQQQQQHGRNGLHEGGRETANSAVALLESVVELEMERIGAHRDIKHYQEELLFLQQQVAAAEADLRALADAADGTRMQQQQQQQQLEALDAERR
ncbi:uncharacterized protein EMH_0071360 [Eimeria mitis]|uniref:Uncharacterized protein n=1 Tax=Eimeria mitis TaxID=44415 RepID=U6K930_9EIME|nr:uncharacterized protein EMH_0071360 [Eimeria mitis]CDJ31978.1 hypothetical protein, conserved [Eimeria mitis]